MSTAPGSSGVIRPQRPCAHCGAPLPASAKFCGRCGQVVIRDFFLSFHRADKGWAEWIAWQLEAAGYSTLSQTWDFRPGSDFVEELYNAAQTTRRTITVLSPDYLTSSFSPLEWEDAFRRSRMEGKRVLLPVRVRQCDVEGLLALLVYIDLLGLDAQAARTRLLGGVRERGRPSSALDLSASAESLASSPPFPAPLVDLWNVPHRRNPSFTGREGTLEQLHARFAAKLGIVTQALTGLGGIGKTQTALEYAFRYQQDYQAVLWVQAETRELLIGDVVRIAALLQLPEREAQEQEVVVAAVRLWLETHPGWLLVLDNLEDAALAREVLPTQGQGHALVTSRSQVPDALDRAMPLSALLADEAVRLLLRRAGLLTWEAPLQTVPAQQQAEARAIAESLGRLTLALDQAGAYIEETGCGLKGYLTLFQKWRTALFSSQGGSAPGYRKTVAVTRAVAFEQVEQASPAAADLLRLCAFLYPEAIAEDLFRDGAQELPSTLAEAVTDPPQWNATLAVLRRFSLIEQQAETETLNLHRLVQVVLQDALPDAERRAWAERAVQLVNVAFPDPTALANWARCEQLLPHALVCFDHIKRWKIASQEAAFLLSQAGYYLDERARFAEALPLYQRALAIREQGLGPTHPDVATSLEHLAHLLREMGQDEQARLLQERAQVTRAWGGAASG